MLRYLRHTANLAIQYNASDSEATMPAGYTDSDFAGDPDDRKSTSGHVLTPAGGAITWRARRRPVTKKESRTCSRIPKDLHCAGADRSPHLDVITNQDQSALTVLSGSGRKTKQETFHEVPL